MTTPYLTIVKRGDDAYDISDGRTRIAAVRLYDSPAVPGEWIIRNEARLPNIDESMTFDSAHAAICFVLMGVLQ